MLSCARLHPQCRRNTTLSRPQWRPWDVSSRKVEIGVGSSLTNYQTPEVYTLSLLANSWKNSERFPYMHLEVCSFSVLHKLDTQLLNLSCKLGRSSESGHPHAIWPVSFVSFGVSGEQPKLPGRSSEFLGPSALDLLWLAVTMSARTGLHVLQGGC